MFENKNPNGVRSFGRSEVGEEEEISRGTICFHSQKVGSASAESQVRSIQAPGHRNNFSKNDNKNS